MGVPGDFGVFLVEQQGEKNKVPLSLSLPVLSVYLLLLLAPLPPSLSATLGFVGWLVVCCWCVEKREKSVLLRGTSV